MMNEIFKLMIGVTIIVMLCIMFLYHGGYYDAL